MDGTVAFLLSQEGITNGAIYGLIALALVLAFAVTRVILVQGGEFVSFGALTLYALQSGRTPATLWVMVVACAASGLLEIGRLRRDRVALAAYLRPLAAWFAGPWLVVALAMALHGPNVPLWIQGLLTLAITVPLGPAMFRLVYQPIAHASVLVLLIVSVACHFVLEGLALVAFGPDGARTTSFSDDQIAFAGQAVPVQGLVVIAVVLVLVLALYGLSKHTMAGRALRATASNRRGAALMGIRTETAGFVSFGIAAFIFSIAGILISPFVTIYYNTGFLISLKAFIGATIGAMASYPVAALGALSIGLFESFAAYWSSGYKDALVFALMIPILLGCSVLARPATEDEAAKSDEREEGRHSAVTTLRRWLSRVPGKAAAVVVLLALAVLPFVLSRFYVSLATYVGLYALVAYGVILLTGVAGQVSLGQAAFVGICAYVSAVLSTTCLPSALGPIGAWLAGGVDAGSCGMSPWASLPIGLAVTALAAWLLGAVTLRMQGYYLPIATIAWSVSIFYVFANTDRIGASSGMTDLPRIPFPGGTTQAYETEAYYLVVALVLLLGWLSRNLLDSRIGRAIRALKIQATMAESVGVDIGSLKTKVFVCAAVYAGLSGWLYAHIQRFIDPTSFGLDMSVEYVFMAVVGGVEQVAGAVLGSAAVRVFTDAIQSAFQSGWFGKGGNVEKVIFGALIIVLLQRTHHGLAYLLLPFRRTVAMPRLPEDGKPSAPPRAVDAVTLLKVEGLTKNFGGLAAVSDVSFQTAQGRILAVIGPNGAGKSTIFNLISGVLKPSAGSIEFAGRRIEGLSGHAIADLGLARTFQHVRLLPDLSVLENAALGAYRRGRAGFIATLFRLDRVEEQQALQSGLAALKRVGLAEVADRPAGSLPLGRQRILEIARALASDPRMLLLDEPAAGLRAAEKRELSDLLRALRGEGMAILLVEHDMSFVMRLADQVVVQNFGRTLACGTPDTIRCNAEVVAAYLGGAA